MSSENLVKLLKWAEEHNVTLPKTIKYFYDDVKGINCIAEEDIQDAHFTIPSNIIITGSLAKKYFEINERPNVWLKFLLAKMKFGTQPMIVDGEDIKEKFTPYIRALPEIIDSPLLWNPHELKLLEGTNLGSSIREKLLLIFKDWKRTIATMKEYVDCVQDEISALEKLPELTNVELYEQITSQAFGNEKLPWYSFRAFLWAHLIFLSRAFPEYILNPKTNNSGVILIPVIDLLNHSYESKVEWRRVDDSFCVRCLEPISQGQEILNNYGGKGNEELLTGYGFVLEDNVFDTVALKIKLTSEILSKILSTQDITLPTLADYTRFAFESQDEVSKSPQSISEYEEGVLYLISEHNDISLYHLIDLFAFLEKNDGESHKSLRAQLQGLQKLRVALEYKLNFSRTNSESSTPDSAYAVKEYRKFCANLYRKNQRQILKHSVNALKRIEKEWTSNHKQDLLTVKKILKADSEFLETDIPALFEGSLDITFDSYNHILLLWVILRHKSPSQETEARYNWVFLRYNDFLTKHQSDSQIPAEIQDLFTEIFPKGSDVVEVEDISTASAFILENSYTRQSNDEIILVRS